MKNSDAFLYYIEARIQTDKGFCADCKRADNEAFEWKLWPVINRFVDIRDEDKRKSYALIASSLAKSNTKKIGSLSLGKAFKILNKAESQEFSPRFMRVLSADSVDELIEILRPSLGYISSENLCLDYKSILDQLLRFSVDAERVKVRWASDYLNVEDCVNE